MHRAMHTNAALHAHTFMHVCKITSVQLCIEVHNLCDICLPNFPPTVLIIIRTQVCPPLYVFKTHATRSSPYVLQK